MTVRAGSPPTAPAPIPATDSQLSFTVFNRALDAVPGRPVAFSEATLSAGREAPPLAVQVAGPADLNAVLAWPGSTYRLSVTGPSGTTTTEPDSSSPPVGFTFPSPPPGTWLFTVRDVASAAGEVSWLVVSRGP